MEEAPRQSVCVDPRIRRTRQMLQDALDRLLTSRSLEQISVSDIAEAAALNRATFYDHYPDKFALLEGMVETRFQDLLRRRSVIFDGQCSGALTGFALAICDYLAETPGIACTSRRPMERHMESAMVSVVHGMIRSGLERHPPRDDISADALAAILSSAIYGGAKQWVRTPEKPPAEQAAATIVALLVPLLHPQAV